MLDIQLIRDHPDQVAEKAAQKGYKIDVHNILKVDEERRQLVQKVENLRHDQKLASEQFAGQQPDEASRNAFKHQKQQIQELQDKLKTVEANFEQLLKAVPNLPLDDVPVGASEGENVVSKTVGEPPQFDFQPKNHAQIAEAKGWLDKQRAAKVTGARFAYLKGDLVQLQFALIQYVLSRLTSQDFIKQVISDNNLQVSYRPFTPVLPPLMLKTAVYDAMDRLEPRDDRYKIEGEELWLQGSAEHVLGSMHLDEILNETDLPIRYLGYASSFRREAGSYGKDMEGMFRMHQFDKLEMESLSLAENGLQEHYLLIAIQEKLMQELGIPYQVITKCTADIGKPNARGIDLNAWLPGQAKYRETHTADYMTDYQARRLKTRVKRMSAQTELVHTNDATAIALSRTPIAIIENFQTAAGDVRIPEVLQPFMGGRQQI